MNRLSRQTNRRSLKRINHFPKVIVLCCLSLFTNVYASSNFDKSWKFKVYLDGDEIGYHHFSMIRSKQQHEIYSSARFDVNFLFINVYSYQHDNVERWQGQCLDSIDSVTNDNGDKYSVNGKAYSDAFLVNTRQTQNRYSPCIKTFAYWDLALIKEPRLLNAQTGELVEVNSKFIGNETVNHQGEDITARHYRLLADSMQIDLWYSIDDHWLALESVTEDGRVVRYAMP